MAKKLTSVEQRIEEKRMLREKERMLRHERMHQERMLREQTRGRERMKDMLVSEIKKVIRKGDNPSYLLNSVEEEGFDFESLMERAMFEILDEKRYESIKDLLKRTPSISKETLCSNFCEICEIEKNKFDELYEKAIREYKCSYDRELEKLKREYKWSYDKELGKLFKKDIVFTKESEIYIFGEIIGKNREMVDKDIENEKQKIIEQISRNAISAKRIKILYVILFVLIIIQIFTIGWWTILTGPITLFLGILIKGRL